MDIPSVNAEGTLAGHRLRKADGLAADARRLDELGGAGLEDVAREFESFFLSMLTKAMRKTVPSDGLFSGGHAEEMFTDLLDQQMAGSAAAHGKGLGIAEMIVKAYRNRTGETPAGKGFEVKG